MTWWVFMETFFCLMAILSCDGFGSGRSEFENNVDDPSGYCAVPPIFGRKSKNDGIVNFGKSQPNSSNSWSSTTNLGLLKTFMSIKKLLKMSKMSQMSPKPLIPFSLFLKSFFRGCCSYTASTIP